MDPSKHFPLHKKITLHPQIVVDNSKNKQINAHMINHYFIYSRIDVNVNFQKNWAIQSLV
jgi:hypothetical protein